MKRALDSPLYSLLARFVAIQTVSGSVEHLEECWRGAQFLKQCMLELGVETNLVSCGEHKSPLILGRLDTSPAHRTLVVYGHYDVQPATEVRGSMSLLCRWPA
jgi:di- and tripeptidase